MNLNSKIHAEYITTAQYRNKKAKNSNSENQHFDFHYLFKRQY